MWTLHPERNSKVLESSFASPKIESQSLTGPWLSGLSHLACPTGSAGDYRPCSPGSHPSLRNPEHSCPNFLELKTPPHLLFTLRAALHNRCTSGWPGPPKTLSAPLHLRTSWIRKSVAGTGWPLEISDPKWFNMKQSGDRHHRGVMSLGSTTPSKTPASTSLIQLRRYAKPHQSFFFNLWVTGLHLATVKEMYALFPMCLHSSPWQLHIQSSFLVFSSTLCPEPLSLSVPYFSVLASPMDFP